MDHAALAFAVIVQDDKGKPIKNIAVALYPNDVSVGSLPKNKSLVTIKQKDKMFDTFVAMVQTGSAVTFPNKDKTRHHVYSFSKAKRFELPLFLGNSKAVTFDIEGIIPLGCNIHDWMLAYVVAVNTPYFGLTNRSGKANLKNVPDGFYTLKYWYPGMKSSELKILAENVNSNSGEFRIVLPTKSVDKPPRKPALADEMYD